MQMAHSPAPVRAVARACGKRYGGGMNSTLYFENRNYSHPVSLERRAPVFGDAVVKKAIARWENEGGKIPELFGREDRLDAMRGRLR